MGSLFKMEENEQQRKSHRIRHKEITHKPTSGDKLTSAERAKRYRETLKKNPKKAWEYSQKEKERKRLRWKNRTEEQIKEDRRKARERQKRFRDNRKMMVVDGVTKSGEKKKVLTRAETEKRREYWRRKQAESRALRSSQKHRRYKEKDRKYHQDIRTRNAVKRSVRKGHLPTDSVEFVNAVEDILSHASPRKMQLLKDKHLLNTPASRKKIMFFDRSSNLMKSIVSDRNIKKNIIRNLSFLRKYRLSKTLSQYLGVSESSISNHSRAREPKQPRKDACPEQDRKAIQNFFHRGDISTNLPTAKRVKKDQNERRVLDRPFSDVYKEFKTDNPGVKASFSTFIRNKPNNIESTRKQPWYGCLCESCTNIDLKLKALSQVAARNRSHIKVKDKYEAAALTLCEKEDGARYHKLKCIQRLCDSCGCDNIVRYYQPLAEASPNRVVVYSKWERVKKQYKGREVTQVMPVSRAESVTEVIVKFSEELKYFAEHLFVASWQQSQFLSIQKDVPKSWVVLNMDFAENYTCMSQHEVQSAHWSKNQITIHPTVAYYRCTEDSCEDIVTEHLIFLSDDKEHDAAAVQQFVRLASEHLIDKRGLTIEKQIQLTDGCAAQYKSRKPFADISSSQSNLGFQVERHFYGSRHGKGPSDGAGAVMKSVAKRAVMGGNVIINDSKDFFEFAKEKMTKEDESHTEHFKRTIFHVNDINRREQWDDSKTLKGTRKVQAVQAVDRLKIKTRNLSCFCAGCFNNTPCDNREYVCGWELHDIKKIDKHVIRGKRAQRRGGMQRDQGEGGVRRAPRRGGVQRDQGEGGVRRGGVQRDQGEGGVRRALRRGGVQIGGGRGQRGVQRGGGRGQRGVQRGGGRGQRGVQRGGRSQRGVQRGGRGQRGVQRGGGRGQRGVQRGGRDDLSSDSDEEQDGMTIFETVETSSTISETVETSSTISDTVEMSPTISETVEMSSTIETSNPNSPILNLSMDYELLQMLMETQQDDTSPSIASPSLEDHLEPSKETVPSQMMPTELESCYALIETQQDDTSPSIASPSLEDHLEPSKETVPSQMMPTELESCYALIETQQDDTSPSIASPSLEDHLEPSKETVPSQMMPTELESCYALIETQQDDTSPSIASPSLEDHLEPSKETVPSQMMPTELESCYALIETQQDDTSPSIASPSLEDHLEPSKETVPSQMMPTELESCYALIETQQDDTSPSIASPSLEDHLEPSKETVPSQMMPTELESCYALIETQQDDTSPSIASPSLEDHLEPSKETVLSQMMPTELESCYALIETQQDDTSPSIASPSLEDHLQPSKETVHSQMTNQESRYNTGDHILVKHGVSKVPAVVGNWPWVTFYSKSKSNSWSLNAVQHTVLASDVLKNLQPPDIELLGSRLFYKFQDL